MESRIDDCFALWNPSGVICDLCLAEDFDLTFMEERERMFCCFRLRHFEVLLVFEFFRYSRNVSFGDRLVPMWELATFCLPYLRSLSIARVYDIVWTYVYFVSSAEYHCAGVDLAYLVYGFYYS